MKLVGSTVLILAGLALAQPAFADCADPPQPGVDWRRCTMHNRDFIDADLTGAKLKSGRFTRVDFSGTDLSKVDGRRAKFIDAVARKAKFDGARLTRADFTEADLTDVSFRNADLYGAQLQGAILKGADLTGAKLEDADLARADLSGARWVDGKTICAEGSIGQCKLGATPRASG